MQYKPISWLIMLILVAAGAFALVIPYNYFTLDNNETMFNEFPNSGWGDVNGSLQGTTSLLSSSECIVDECVNFTGAGFYNFGDADFPTGDRYSFACWVYAYDSGTIDGFISKSWTGRTYMIRWEDATDNFALRLEASNDLDISYSGNYGEWKHIMVTRDSVTENGTSYFDGVNVGSRIFADTASGNQDVCYGTNECDGATGSDNGVFILDECKNWNVTLTPAQVLEEFQSYAPADNTSTIDLLFSNTTSSTYKTLFGEGEDSLIYINWTNDDDNSALNDSVGSCNISVIDGFVEIIGNATAGNRSICNSGCDIDTNETREITFPSSVNAINDSVHFDICHEQIASGNLVVDFQCGALTDSVVVEAANIPLCSLNTAFVRVSSSVCSSSDIVNFSQTADIPFSQRKRILDIHFDREYSLDLNSDEVIFNSTLQLWQNNHTHEYYDHGSKRIFANCSHDADNNFNNNVSENITIVNIFPQVFIEQIILPDGSIINLTNGIVLEYQNGTYQLLVSVVDDDTNNFYLNTTNISNQTILFEASNLSNLFINSDEFVDFESGPFNITLFANDTANNQSTTSLTFSFNDTADPSCSFADSYQVSLTGIFSFDVTCTDENFFSLNVTCPNNLLDFGVSGLNVQSYDFNQNISIPGNFSGTTCTARYCDGHTGILSKNWDVIAKDNRFEFIVDAKPVSSIWISEDPADVTLDYKILDKKVTFDFILPPFSIGNFHTIYYQSSNNSYYFKDDKYTAWIVDAQNEIWFDLNNVPGKYTIIERENGLWEILIETSEKELRFESIGELNCVNASFTLEDVLEDWGVFSNIRCPLEQDLTFVIGWFALIIMLFCLVAANEIMFKIPIFTFFSAFGFIALALSVYACSIMFSIPFWVFAVMLFWFEIDRLVTEK